MDEMVSLRMRRYGKRHARSPLLGAVCIIGLVWAGACTVDQPDIGLTTDGTSPGGADGSSFGAAASGLSGASVGDESGGLGPDNMGGAPESEGRAGARNTAEGGEGGSMAGSSSAAGTGGSKSTNGGAGAGGVSSMAGSGGTGGTGGGSAGAGGSGGAPDVHSGPFGILVLEKTLEFRHDSIQACEDTLTALGKTSNAQMPSGTKPGSQFTITIAKDDLSDFTDAGLKNYALVFFCLPSGRVFSTGGAAGTAGMTALQNFVEGGGAWAGVHAALDFEKTGGFPWFTNTLTGTTWTTHDNDGTQATVQIAAAFSGHPVVSGLPASWAAADEWYYWQTDIRTLPGFQVLQTIAADQRPVTWIKQVGQGRMFYSSRGHNKNYYAEANFQRLILNGVLWATQRLN